MSLGPAALASRCHRGKGFASRTTKLSYNSLASSPALLLAHGHGAPIPCPQRPSTSAGQELAHVLFADRIVVQLRAPIQGRPLGLVLEQAHRVDVLDLAGQLLRRDTVRSPRSTHVGLVRRKAVVDARGKDQQVVLLELDAHPVFVPRPHVKVALAAADVADLLVLVQVLVEEHLDLVLVDVAHLFGRHGDLIAVLVAPLGGQLVDALEAGEAVVQDAEPAELILAHGPARVVRKALVPLEPLDS